MKTYIKFDFSDNECGHFPVTVCIERDTKLTAKEFESIKTAINNKIDEYVESGEYWETDELLVQEVLEQSKDDYGFTYEIVNVDFMMEC
jgi:hypothetical protein